MSDDDVDRWEKRANLTQGWRAVGGRLSVADGRVGFGPHAIDAATGGSAFDAPLSDLVSVDLAPRTFHPFNGGMRVRLRLRFSDGQERLIVVNGARDVGERVAESARAAGGSPDVEL